MSSLAIKVESLSKLYKVGTQRQPYYTLREVIAGFLQGSWGVLCRRSNGSIDEEQPFWALKDISFEVNHGEVLGLIGRNGAGKSTLLKILSRITEPTAGRARLYGRVGSLLEVGTGFHPELTGRENIFLSGSTLGMSKSEIKRKFDAIVDFSEAELFLDTPVKRFSSGMYMRLAFGVMAFLEPEILLVDEVLAVGDFHFQKKCLGRMNDIARGGRTILFVSHNMAAVQRLCHKTLLIDAGRMAYNGPTDLAVKKYIETNSTLSEEQKLLWTADDRAHPFTDLLRIERFFVMDGDGQVVNSRLYNSKKYWAVTQVHIFKNDAKLIFMLYFYDKGGTLMFVSSVHDSGGVDFGSINIGDMHLIVPIPVEWFWNDVYQVELCIALHYTAWILKPDNESRLRFEVVRDIDLDPYSNETRQGILAPVIKWEIKHS